MINIKGDKDFFHVTNAIPLLFNGFGRPRLDNSAIIICDLFYGNLMMERILYSFSYMSVAQNMLRFIVWVEQQFHFLRVDASANVVIIHIQQVL